MFPNGSVYVDMLLKPVVDGGYRLDNYPDFINSCK